MFVKLSSKLVKQFPIKWSKKSRIELVFLDTPCDWFRKLAPLSPPIRWKTEINRDLVIRIFPRPRQLVFNYSEISLAPYDIVHSSDWPLILLWFW